MNETFQVFSDSVIFCAVKYLGYTCYYVRIDLSFQKEDSFTSIEIFYYRFLQYDSYSDMVIDMVLMRNRLFYSFVNRNVKIYHQTRTRM